MRRVLVSILVPVLMLAMLAAFTGCGGEGNESVAQEHMQKGDSFITQAESGYLELGEKEDELVNMITANEMDKLMGEEGKEINEEIGEVKAGIRDDLEVARSQYRAIKRLDDVEDYKDYADKMLQVVSLYEELLDWDDKLSVEYEKAITDAFVAGESFDITSFMAQSEGTKKMEELEIEMDDSKKEAEEFKQDEGL